MKPFIFERAEKAANDAVVDLMNRERVTTGIHISADSITLTASRDYLPTSTCRYCGSTITGNRCESCGAPRQEG